jgi:undecaprenyl diphosphate synthase
MAEAQSIGIIMDGNRRWAQAQSLPGLKGHLEGVRRLVDVVHWAKERGHVRDIFFYALSTENWQRDPREVEYLLLLIELFCITHAERLAVKGVRVRIAGQRDRFPRALQRLFIDLETRTEENTTITVWLGLSYGGRAELLDAAYRLSNGKHIPTESELKRMLWTADLPDPDVIVRTGGEKRLSNFLTWGSVYSELFFSDTLWPAFTKEEFNAILDAYEARDRRRGV